MMAQLRKLLMALHKLRLCETEACDIFLGFHHFCFNTVPNVGIVLMGDTVVKFLEQLLDQKEAVDGRRT